MSDPQTPTFSELRDKDIPRYMKIAEAMAAKSPVDPEHVPLGVVRYFNQVVWPTIAQMLTMTEEVDEAVDDLIEGAEDVLQAETASIIGMPIVLADKFIELALPRLGQLADADPLKQTLILYQQARAKSLEALGEITIPADPDDVDDDDDDDEEDD